MSSKLGIDEGRGSTRQALGELLREVGPFALIGLVVAALLLFVFAKLSEDVFSNEITNLDNNASLWVHGLANPTLDLVFKAVSTGVGIVGVIVLGIAGFVFLLKQKHPHDAWRLALVVVGGVIINQVLKFLFHRSRPELWSGPTFAGFSFPSGHATLSFCLFGLFIWLGWRYFKREAAKVAWTALMVALILLVGLSRIYLGAHFLSDVLAGYLSAGAWLVAVLSGTDIYDRVRKGRAVRAAEPLGVGEGREAECR